MNKLLPVSRIVFGLAMLGLGVLCLISHDFIIGRPPLGKLPVAIAYLGIAVVIVSSIAVILKKMGFEAALAIAGCILLLSISLRLPVFMEDYLNAYKSFALFGGSLIVAASFKEKWHTALIWTGCILLCAFFVAAGYAHIIFYDFILTFIPAYIPFHGFFTYFTAASLIAGGIGLLIPPTRKWAALLSGIMVGGWFLFLHIPRLIDNPGDVGERMGFFESLAFTGIFFVLAVISDRKKG